MHEVRLARLRLLLLATLAFGCSSASISGSYAAIAGGFPGAAVPPLAR
jgi:hypothetical protein